MSVSNRVLEESVFFVDGAGLDTPSTKAASNAIKELSISKSFVFVYGENDDSLVKSFRNLSNSKLTSVTKLSTYDVISNEALVFSENAINTFLEQR